MESKLSISFFITLVGDCPAAMIRWKCYQNENGPLGICVDRLMVLTQFRCKGYAYRCLLRVIEDATRKCGSLGFIIISLPKLDQYAWVASKLGSLGFTEGPPAIGNQFGQSQQRWGGVDMYSMVCMQGTESIRQYLTSKIAV